MKAALDGVKRDGCGRKIDEFFSLQPYAGGRAFARVPADGGGNA